jgi:hypothetical protein
MENTLIPLLPPIARANCIFEVTGNDMAPEYPSGARVACRRIKLPAPFFEWGETYLINTVNGPILRRVNTIGNAEFVRCYSSNPDQDRYAPFDLPLNAIIDIYRVIAVAVRV